MSDWKEYRFGELCDISRGASPRPINDYLGSDGMPWIKIADATSSDSRYIERTAECIKLSGVQASVRVYPGDLILSNSATPGLPKFVSIDACVHDGWMLLRNFRGITKQFAYWLLLFERANLVSRGNGSVFTNLKTDILRSHRVQIPSLTEQERIASILDALASKIELNRRTAATLEEMARAVFRAWFVDFLPVEAMVLARAEGRNSKRAMRAAMSGRDEEDLDALPPETLASLPAGAFPDGFAVSGDVQIPSGWRIEPLTELTSYLNRGLTPSYLERGGVLVLNQRCVRPAGIDLGAARRHDSLKRPLKERQLQVGDVLVNSTGVGTLGRVAQVMSLPEPSTVDSHVTIVRANDVEMQHFLGILLEGREDEIVALAEGTTGQTELSRTKLGALTMVVPSADVLVAFNQLVGPLRMAAAQRSAENARLAAVRNALLPELLSGSMSVRVEEAAIV